MQNACTVITAARAHARAATTPASPRCSRPRTRRRSSPGESTHDLDAPILIRTAYLVDGALRVPVGRDARAPLRPVRRGQRDARQGRGRARRDRRRPPRPRAELALPPRRSTPTRSTRTRRAASRARSPTTPHIAALLASRNARLASFWLNPQDARAAAARSPGARAIVVDAEDRFTTMLAHQLRHLGLDGRDRARGARSPTSRSTTPSSSSPVPDPGDPRDPRHARGCGGCARSSRRRRASGRPLLAVCLSHQILADSLGIELAPLDAPHQGLQKTVDVFGTPASIGFYNTFTARVARGHHASSARRRSRPIRPRATSTRCADRGSRRCRGTSSRSCRATG